MKTCCLCHKQFSEYDNNPWPLADPKEDGPCCDECDCLRVIPARLVGQGFSKAQAQSIGEVDLKLRRSKKAWG
jgi:hypothetical protein